MLSRCLIYRSVEVEFFLPSRKACSGIHETQTAFKTSTQTQQTPKPEKGGKIPFVLHVTLKDATTSWGDVRKGRGFFFCNTEEEKKLLMSLWFLFSSPSLPVWVFRSPRQMLLSHLLRAQKLWTSPGGGLFCFKSHDLTATCDLCITTVTPPGNKEIRSSQRPVYHRKALAKGGL